MSNETNNNSNSYETVKDNLTPITHGENIDDFEVDDAFNYEGFQVVRGEFFAHIFEPSLTFNRGRISVNMACINKLPSIDYVLPLVSAKERRVAIKPTTEDVKDSFIWCTYARKNNKRRPKQVTCPVFFHKIVEMMGWNPDYRYKILGKMIRSNGEYLFIFDLNNAEVYQRIFKEGEKTVSSRKPLFPAEWQNQFGLPYEEHKKSLQVNLFNGYTVFGIKSNTSKNIDTENDAKVEEQPVNKEKSPDNNSERGEQHGF